MGSWGDSPSSRRRRHTSFSTLYAELAQRLGFLASGPLPPADAGSETRTPKRHTCPTTAFTCD
eukprot:11231752-Alexandrium_andersonii.AAC.1